DKQRELIVFALGLSLIVVIPVYILLFSFAWRYREGNHKKAKYNPELSGNRWAEGVWWLIPTVLITILSVVAWDSSHTLDPYRSLDSGVRPIRIQVVAMDWKWLFIYPEQHVASVNLFQFPKGTPLDFQITSDAPMNSFWIPQLGGQIYAMPGMVTQLHLQADRTGNFNGWSANISGDGFARMTFVARSSSKASYEAWLDQLRRSPDRLDVAAYEQLSRPGESSFRYYSSVQSGMFDAQVMKYLVPTTTDGKTYHFMPSVNMGMGG
ncbi:MAG: COX aromatic rich motif-containing protein, partial [Candidatus Saccharimonadales bacterium]